MFLIFRILLLLTMLVGVICATDNQKSGAVVFGISGALMLCTFLIG